MPRRCVIDESIRALYAERGRLGLNRYVEEVHRVHRAFANLIKLMAGLDPTKSKP